MARQIVLVCVALLAVQAAHGSLPDMKSLLQNQLNKAKELAQGVITTVETTVDGIREKVETEVQNEVIKVENSVKGFAGNVISKVESITQKAEAEGKAVADCVLAVPGEVHDVADSVIQSAISCVTDPIQEARTIIDNLVSLANQVNETFYDVQGKVAECDSKAGALESSLCKLNALGNVAVEITNISTQISTEVAHAIQLVSGLQTSFSTCEVSVWTNAPVQAASIITAVNQCLHDAVSQ